MKNINKISLLLLLAGMFFFLPAIVIIIPGLAKAAIAVAQVIKECRVIKS